MVHSIETETRRIPAEYGGLRLDRALAGLFPEYSRSRLQTWVKQGRIQLDGVASLSVRHPVRGGEWVALSPLIEPASTALAEDLQVQMVYQDEHLLVIDKPAGLVVHPAAGVPSGTLHNGLLHLDPELSLLPRAGLVHRLDKDTTGLLLVARHLRAHHALVAALQRRDVKREYRALVSGVPVAGGTIEAPIGRHPKDRTRMAVVPSGKPAVTHFRIIQRYRQHALLAVQLETGRTHQIRVHLAQRGYPVLGDPSYGGRLRVPAGAAEPLVRELRQFKRQALHACRLSLQHPITGAACDWSAPLPEDFAQLLEHLEADV